MASRASREVKKTIVETEEKLKNERQQTKKPDLRQDFNTFLETVFRAGRKFSPQQVQEFEARANTKVEMEQVQREAMGVRPAKTEKLPIMSSPTELKPEALAWALALAEGFETAKGPEEIGKAIRRWVSTKDILESGRG